jgi:hypothetical protein
LIKTTVRNKYQQFPFKNQISFLSFYSTALRILSQGQLAMQRALRDGYAIVPRSAVRAMGEEISSTPV